MNLDIKVPGFKILRPLGEGGMASVYLAVQESLDREVALKVMSPQLVENEEFTQRFLKEGKVTAKMSHPNLVTVYDIGQVGDTYYLATEYIPGGTLRDRMNRGIGVLEALDVARDVAAGLAYAHEKGVVHRDVKPGNVLFKNNGTAVLADFGIAKSLNSKTMATQAGNSIGTPHYMSPEQARAEPVDGRSDMYSLGAMLFEVLVGKPPYQAADPFSIALMHVTNPVPEFPKELAWLQPILSKLMAKDANNRFATGDAFIVALDELMATSNEAQKLRDLEATKMRQVPKTARMNAAPAKKVSEESTTQSKSVESVKAKPAWLWPAVGLGAILVAGGLGYSMKKSTTAPIVVTTTEQQNSETPPIGNVTTESEPTNGQITDASLTDAGLSTNIDGNESMVDGGNDVVDNTTVSDVANADGTAVATIDPDSLGLDGPALIAGTDIANMTRLADAYLMQGFSSDPPGRHLATPTGDNAIELYQRILQIDAGNANAKNGLRKIAGFFASKAQMAMDRGLHSAAQIILDDALRATPNDPNLLQLQAEAQRRAGM